MIRIPAQRVSLYFTAGEAAGQLPHQFERQRNPATIDPVGI